MTEQQALEMEWDTDLEVLERLVARIEAKGRIGDTRRDS